MTAVWGFQEVLKGVSPAVAGVLSRLSAQEQQRVREIRLRVGMPLCLTTDTGTVYVGENGLTGRPGADVFVVRGQDVQESYYRLSERSVYAKFHQIREGYLTLPGGHRAGLCGTVDNQKGIGELSSINLRVARQIPGAADGLTEYTDPGGWLLYGPPGSGKTTVLRDLVRQLSIKGNRVCVVDCRGELAAMYGGRTGFDLGPNTDVLTGCPKAEGVSRAIRTMNPGYVAFDEIGSPEELAAVRDSLTAGVEILTTLHAADEVQLKQRTVGRALLDSGAVRHLVRLTEPGGPMAVTRIPWQGGNAVCGSN